MSTLLCKDENRRHEVRKAELNGLDYVEVSQDRRRLTVFLLGKAPAWLRSQNVTIEGGRRIRDIRVIDLDIHRHDDPEVDDCLVVTVDRPGDFSTYQLGVRALDREGRPTREPLEGFDRRYACVDFSFTADCPSELDCKQDPVCPPEPREDPELHYLAKDYASFRQLILDRLSLVMPEWRERHVPDIGITLVEILAYVGDHLSYYQDAVATEAYIDTARERISVRRHARLVDYFVHEGCNARAWVVLETSQNVLALDPDTIFFLAAAQKLGTSMRKAEKLTDDPTGDRIVFEPIVEGDSEIVLRAARNSIRIYAWGDAECCLPRGATRAELVDPGEPAPAEPLPEESEGEDDALVQDAGKEPEPSAPPQPEHTLELQRCDVLIFEEVRGPKTGDPADADPEHRDRKSVV